MIIECTYGPVTTEVMGTAYNFTLDKHGRYVAEVWNPKHAASFLAVTAHYRQVPEQPDAPVTTAAAAKEKVKEEKVEAAKEEVKEEKVEEAKPARKKNAPIPVTEINGIGPALETKLADVGITDARQIAVLSAKDVSALDDELGLGGRIARDKWVEQARALST